MRMLSYFVRFVAISTVATLALVAYGVLRIGTLFAPAGEERRAAVAHLRGRVLRAALARLGATFIKLGQVMSTRPDLLDREIIEELRLLQDRLPPFAGERARAQIEAELGKGVDALFESFDVTPVAAASVAQVHRARAHDGTDLAVKVLRPDVRAKTERDAAILLWLARLAMRVHTNARHANVAGHLEHFVEGVLAQTDLRIEASHYERFRENFRNFSGVVFPRVYPAWCGEHVLTMDYIRGRKVDALAKGEHPEIAPRLREIFLKMLFEDGFLHADMHPGNLLITDAGDVAIFDVGLCKLLSEELLEQYIDFNRCLVMGTTADYVRHLRTYHSYAENSVDWTALEGDVDALRAQFQGKSASQIEFGAIIEQSFALGRRHGIHPVTEMTLMMVGLVTAEGIGKQLDPHADSFGHVARYLGPILARRGMTGPPVSQTG